MQTVALEKKAVLIASILIAAMLMASVFAVFPSMAATTTSNASQQTS